MSYSPAPRKLKSKKILLNIFHFICLVLRGMVYPKSKWTPKSPVACDLDKFRNDNHVSGAFEFLGFLFA